MQYSNIHYILILLFLIGCSDKEMTEDEITFYYNVNKENSLNKLRTIVPTNGTLKNGAKDLFNIVHISDAHVAPGTQNNSIPTPINLLEALKFANEPEASINIMVATGDHISNVEETTREQAISFLDVVANTLYNNNNIPTFPSTGNHDANMMNPEHRKFALSKADMYNHLTSKINYPIRTTGTENYYYADIPNSQGRIIRIISLDVMDQEGVEYDAQHYAIISQKQIDWLCETALKENMTTKHSVIVLIHYPLPTHNEYIRQSAFNDFLYNWESIPEIIEAFRTKRSFYAKYKNKFIPTDTLCINTSFENVPGEFICYLGGHIHTYANYEVDGFKNSDSSLPKQIMIIANNMSPSQRNKKSPIERHSDGLQNNTFNIYMIDTNSKTIYITFFGATSFYYPNVIKLQYL